MIESPNIMEDELPVEYFRYLESRHSDEAVPMSMDAFFELGNQVCFTWKRDRGTAFRPHEACNPSC